MGGLAAVLVWCSMALSNGLFRQSDVRAVDFSGLLIAASGSAVYSGVLVGLASLALRIIGGQKRTGSGAATVVSNKWRMLTG
jgi:hypothetical protein